MTDGIGIPSPLRIDGRKKRGRNAGEKEEVKS